MTTTIDTMTEAILVKTAKVSSLGSALFHARADVHFAAGIEAQLEEAKTELGGLLRERSDAFEAAADLRQANQPLDEDGFYVVPF
tara:strand:+ start:233 stop:487 length:255 start_codon:yes stop_codon:yes gene_type:complete